MQILEGIAVSPGVAIGEALVIDNEGFRIPRRFVARDVIQQELERFDKAIAAVGREMEQNRDAVTAQLGKEYGAIFSAHLAMLRDPKLHDEIEQLIRQRHYSPEYAVSRTLRRYAKVFESLDSSYLSQRAHDVFDIEKNLLRQLLGLRREELSQLTAPVIVMTHNLTPSETARLDPKFVLGFVTETGGAGSHTAIVAEALEIPAVVGTGACLCDVSGGELVIVDGDQGRVILQPDEETVARYRHEKEEHRSLAVRLEGLRDLPAETHDGVRVDLMANIEFPYEVDACLARGCDGVGLYRTEFLYLGSDAEPSEEDHYRAYSRVVAAMSGRPVTIRTIDLGADKLEPGRSDLERNPFLGLRSIRLSLRDLPLFRTQLRAVLRASALGPVRLMFPLVSTVQEFRKARMVLGDVMEDLDEEKIPFDRQIAVGMMVEVPAAVIMMDAFVREADFISIGTNDLIQYTLAVDRSNKDVASLYNAADPAVLKLIDMAVRSAGAAGVPVNVCGQMSSHPSYIMLLLGLGLRSLSVPPAAIPEIKRICRSVSVEQCQAIAARALEMETARAINTYLREELRKIVPELAMN